MPASMVVPCVRKETISATEKIRSDVVWFCISRPLRWVCSNIPPPSLVTPPSGVTSAGPSGQCESKLLEKDHWPIGAGW